MKRARRLKPIQQPKVFPDCSTCRYGTRVEYNMYSCSNRHCGPIPQPNCKEHKVNCIYYLKEENYGKESK